MALPLGELSPKVIERARLLTEKRRHGDGIALTKANAYHCVDSLGKRACPLRLLRSHLSQRERLSPVGRLLLNNALPIHRKGDDSDSTSVTQKACQTPVGPSWRQSSHASGMMKMTYRQREMTSEAAPLPRPSSAPEEVVDTADTTKPRQMMRRAVWPMAMVSGLEENRPMRARKRPYR